VVANSQTQYEWLKRRWWLEDKVSCIYNGVDPGLFAGSRSFPNDGRHLRLAAVGRVGPEKNALNLIRGLVSFHRQWGYVPQVSWIGERDRGIAGKIYCRQVDELLERSVEVRQNWRWLGEETDIPGLLREHHALIHPSLYEGLPNVVCEALASGMPVLVSNVCDHPRLIADGERGFLFNPTDPDSIARAMKRLADLGAEDWLKFSHNARRYAEENLSIEKMISAYETLFARLLSHRTAKRCKA
jgi:glycosyltransferase involved in cell wall biosynthesis